MKRGTDCPCHCGSGLTFEDCCLKNESEKSKGIFAWLLDELNEKTKNQDEVSLDDLVAMLNEIAREHNCMQETDFKGLSPVQMGGLLQEPFDAPDVVTFSDILDVQPSAPIITLFQILVDAIGDKGLKPTATGSLPRKLVREAAHIYYTEEEYRAVNPFGEFLREAEFRDLHIARFIAELAGLIRMYQGKFILSQNCRKLVAKHGMAAIYSKLFKTYTKKYNWSFADHYPDNTLIQDSFMFTLYLLHKYGDEWRPHGFYEDAIVQAFPTTAREFPALLGRSSEQIYGRVYSLRCLRRFARFFGLIEIISDPDDILHDHYMVRKLPLLDEVVKFHV